jgi:hypothetical protein
METAAPGSPCLSCQVAKTRQIGSAAAKCSRPMADLHLTFNDLIRPSDLPRRPSLTSVPLPTDRIMVSLGTTPYRLLNTTSASAASAAPIYGLDGGPPTYATGTAQLALDTVTVRTNAAPCVQRWGTALQEGPSLLCPDPETLQVRRPARL